MKDISTLLPGVKSILSLANLVAGVALFGVFVIAPVEGVTTSLNLELKDLRPLLLGPATVLIEDNAY